MEPGRELDALVAEKVMGWKLIDRKSAGWGDGPPVWATGDESWDGSPTFQDFRPSVAIRHAWEVVEKWLATRQRRSTSDPGPSEPGPAS